MKILSISAQKPSSTGSGVYLTELVKEIALQGHEQAVVAGVYKEDETNFPEGVAFHPVYFCTEELPYPIVGMSDEMPYTSTRYCDMTEEMVEQFRDAFLKVLVPLVNEFKPDLILTHHLYLLTAIVRETFSDIKVYGFCHNTDLRQMIKTDLEREFIAENVSVIDSMLAEYPALKIIMVANPPCAHINTNTQTLYQEQNRRYNMSRYYELLTQNVENASTYKNNVFVVPAYMFVDREKAYDQNQIISPCKRYDEEVEYGRDFIHCSETGMYQISDALVPYIYYAIQQ